jgi:hypothetical protein
MKISYIRSIIDKTTTKEAVISSSWRTDGLDIMKDLWKYRDLPGEVIDVTPDSYDLIRQGKFEFMMM